MDTGTYKIHLNVYSSDKTWKPDEINSVQDITSV